MCGSGALVYLHAQRFEPLARHFSSEHVIMGRCFLSDACESCGVDAADMLNARICPSARTQGNQHQQLNPISRALKRFGVGQPAGDGSPCLADRDLRMNLRVRMGKRHAPKVGYYHKDPVVDGTFMYPPAAVREKVW